MSHSETTPAISLPQFIETDKPSFLGDWNLAMQLIDAAMFNVQQAQTAQATDLTAVKQSVNAMTSYFTALGIMNVTNAQAMKATIDSLVAFMDAGGGIDLGQIEADIAQLKIDVVSAKNAANTAQSTANTAKSTADSAAGQAAAAQTTANAAQGAANTATTNASSAVSTANAANTAATNASNKADAVATDLSNFGNDIANWNIVEVTNFGSGYTVAEAMYCAYNPKLKMLKIWGSANRTYANGTALNGSHIFTLPAGIPIPAQDRRVPYIGPLYGTNGDWSNLTGVIGADGIVKIGNTLSANTAINSYVRVGFNQGIIVNYPA